MTAVLEKPGVHAATDPFTALPGVRVEPDARARIRAAHARCGRRIAVLDDDPTGSQTVHDVTAVTGVDSGELARALHAPGSTCFVLTNTRSLPEPAAVEINLQAARAVFEIGEQMDATVEIVSRSDSTLRGHVIAEVAALEAVRRDAIGRGVDGVLLVPAYFEAGRCTIDDVHWARVDGTWTPVGETEFARDPSFGYTASNLRQFVAEKSGGTIAAGSVRSIGLNDIRIGGPSRVAEILRGVTGGAFVVVNAACYADLEVVVLGLLDAEDAGRSFLFRSGPSFVRALAGLEPHEPLTADELWPAGYPDGHGLVVVGSHVAQTGRQLAALNASGDIAEVELDVLAVVDPLRRRTHVADVALRVRHALRRSDVVLSTTRGLIRGIDAEDSLAIARTVSRALVDIVASARSVRPAWVLAKGGITSHDVARHGLGVRRAVVLGQLLPGLVTVMRPVAAAPEAVGMPFVVFAGNVGDDTTLAAVVDRLRGSA